MFLCGYWYHHGDLSQHLSTVPLSLLGPTWSFWSFWTSWLCGWPRREGRNIVFEWFWFYYWRIINEEMFCLHSSSSSLCSVGPSWKAWSAWRRWSPWASWDLCNAACKSPLTSEAVTDILFSYFKYASSRSVSSCGAWIANWILLFLFAVPFWSEWRR